MLASIKPPVDPLGDDAYFKFCDEHDIWRVERVGGSFVMTPPMGRKGSKHEAWAMFALAGWAATHDYVPFSPSLGVRFENGDIRMPDVALISRVADEALDVETRDKVSRIILDVVVEVVSKTDRVSDVEEKCEHAWLADGHKYVLMLDPFRKTARAWGVPPADFPSPEELLAEILR